MSMHRDRRATQQSAKIGPPLRGRLEKPAGGVMALARATGPRCAPFLPSGLLQSIPAHKSAPERLS